jgi:hypothetical protein
MGQTRGAYRVWVGKPDRKTTWKTPMHTWEDNTKIDLQEIGWVGMEWIQLALDRNWWQALGNTAMNHQFP